MQMPTREEATASLLLRRVPAAPVALRRLEKLLKRTDPQVSEAATEEVRALLAEVQARREDLGPEPEAITEMRRAVTSVRARQAEAVQARRKVTRMLDQERLTRVEQEHAFGRARLELEEFERAVRVIFTAMGRSDIARELVGRSRQFR